MCSENLVNWKRKKSHSANLIIIIFTNGVILTLFFTKKNLFYGVYIHMLYI